MVAVPDLIPFFNPRSIAVIGASRKKGKVGYSVFKNIIKNGFKGKAYPVNPEAKEIQGYKCYPRVGDIPDEIDLSIIIVPAKFVPQLMQECGKKKVKGALVISAGFKESGIEGARREKEILQIASQYKMRLWGPNCLGLINPHSCLNASFARGMPQKGGIAFMSQSGALCTAILDHARAERMGFSKFASMGNKADVDEIDFLIDFASDVHTRVICGYLENVKNGTRFMKVAKKVSKKRPVILIKSGTTSAGGRAASSHTGSLSGFESAYNACFRQTGIMRAQTLEELFDLGLAFSTQPLPKGDRLAILTNAGGPGILCTDACEKADLKMASFEKKTIDKLRSFLPAAANFYNPVDVLGDASANLYEQALNAILKDRNVDAAIVLLTPQEMTEIKKTAGIIVQISRHYKKTLLCCFMGKYNVQKGIKILREAGIPNYFSPEKAVYSLKAMDSYKHWQDLPLPDYEKIKADTLRAKKILLQAQREDRPSLSDTEAQSVLSSYGICFPESRLATSPEQAVEIGREIGYPLVMKINALELRHKTDVGGVITGIRNEEELRKGYEEIILRVNRFVSRAHIFGISLQQMIEEGKEVILGMNRDPQFGPLIMFGLGGIYVEVLKDVSFRLAPIDASEAQAMIEEIRAYPLLRGVRGEKPVDIKAIVDCLLRLSQLSQDFPQLVELDINPLKVNENGAWALDARMTIGLRKSDKGGN